MADVEFVARDTEKMLHGNDFGQWVTFFKDSMVVEQP